MLNIGVLVSGGGTNLQTVIDRIEDGSLEGVRITAVACTNTRAYALERARLHGIDHAAFPKKDYPDALSRETAMAGFLKARDVELVVLAGFLMIFSQGFISAFGGRIINIHPALLPEFGGNGFYGLRVHQAVLASGAPESGATVHFVVPETDAGPIILQKRVPVLPGDTPELLQERVMTQAEQIILPQAIGLIAKGAVHI